MVSVIKPFMDAYTALAASKSTSGKPNRNMNAYSLLNNTEAALSIDIPLPFRLVCLKCVQHLQLQCTSHHEYHVSIRPNAKRQGCSSVKRSQTLSAGASKSPVDRQAGQDSHQCTIPLHLFGQRDWLHPCSQTQYPVMHSRWRPHRAAVSQRRQWCLERAVR